MAAAAGCASRGLYEQTVTHEGSFCRSASCVVGGDPTYFDRSTTAPVGIYIIYVYIYGDILHALRVRIQDVSIG